MQKLEAIRLAAGAVLRHRRAYMSIFRKIAAVPFFIIGGILFLANFVSANMMGGFQPGIDGPEGSALIGMIAFGIIVIGWKIWPKNGESKH